MFRGPAVVKHPFVAPKEHVFGPCSMAGKDRWSLQELHSVSQNGYRPQAGDNVGLRVLRKQPGASLAVQWSRILLPMQETRVWSLAWEDSTYTEATKPVSHNYWACAPEPRSPESPRRETTTERALQSHALQPETPPQGEACAPKLERTPAPQPEKSPRSSEDPAQPRIKTFLKNESSSALLNRSSKSGLAFLFFALQCYVWIF